MKPNWEFLNESIITNFKNQHQYKVISGINYLATEAQVESIVQACNSPEVFKWLFQAKCPDGYTKEDAIGFINWANDGWINNRYFVFFIIAADNSIVGAIDIKTDNLQAAEIGYWIHDQHTGLARNAVSKLTELAKKAGYKILFAQTREGNSKSEKVLINNHFKVNGEYLRSSKCDKAFCLNL